MYPSAGKRHLKQNKGFNIDLNSKVKGGNNESI